MVGGLKNIHTRFAKMSKSDDFAVNPNQQNSRFRLHGRTDTRRRRNLDNTISV